MQSFHIKNRDLAFSESIIFYRMVHYGFFNSSGWSFSAFVFHSNNLTGCGSGIHFITWISKGYIVLGGGLALVGVVLTTVFGIFEYVNQYTVLLLQAISMLPTIIATALGFPNKDYFSTETQDNH